MAANKLILTGLYEYSVVRVEEFGLPLVSDSTIKCLCDIRRYGF